MQVCEVLLLSLLASTDALSSSVGETRREILGKSAASVFGGVASSSGWLATPQGAFAQDDVAEAGFTCYQIFPDASATLYPTLKPVQSSHLNNVLAMTSNGGGAVWLGEHHNSARDHMLQADFVRNIHRRRREELGAQNGNMSVGLEMVQLQFQPVLDAFIANKITADQMKQQVQWEKRWAWSFHNYLPVFEACRELSIPLIALNVDSEDLGLVESGGFPNLPREKMQKYISDPAGFASFAASPYYKTYVDYVISPSYDVHQQMGILKTTITGQRLEEDMPFSCFFSGRILWDEAMANTAFKWNKDHEGGLIVGLVGADHVKFQGGITGRYQRMAKDKQLNCISVILNPSLIDTRPSGSVSMMSNAASSASASGMEGLTLQLRYLKRGVDVGSPESRESTNTGGVLTLADYLVLTN
eukprot:CCRYP_016194-RA/>CCRYP_016194-RA protein AED:0.33 eAED:0.33 QI:0/-1/0/1/-1/1/1/0/415